MINGTVDHVHILAKLRQDKAVSKLIGKVKANSSGWISRTFAGSEGFEWQEGYGAFTVSESQVPRSSGISRTRKSITGAPVSRRIQDAPENERVAF